MKKITLSTEARRRIAHQIAEASGVVVECNGVFAAPSREHPSN